jgi:two-component system response regulator PilR (NtrC family)
MRKVGSTVEEAVDVRIISATHHLLKDCVDAGTFRQDLYYRVNVIELRCRLARTRRGCRATGRSAAGTHLRRAQPPRLEAQALTALKAYSFPGNVRELENILERATALCNDGNAVVSTICSWRRRGGQ